MLLDLCLSDSTSSVVYFCFNVTATTEFYTYLHTLSLHDALPIWWHGNTPPRGEAGRGAACWREGRRLLAESEARQTGMGRLRVLGAEGLTAFKLQALVNDPSRL